MNYEYKYSGIEWIGEIPAHWDIDRIKALFSDYDEQVSKEKIQSEEVIYHYSIPAFDINEKPETVGGEEISSSKKIVRNGQILFSKLNCWKPRVWIIEGIDETKYNVGSTEFVVLNPWYQKKVHRRFYAYIFGSVSFIDKLKTNLKSVTNSHQRIQPSDLLTSKVPIPPIEEQFVITNYLDRACADIDRVMEIKRKQIENLQQQLKAKMSFLCLYNGHKELIKTGNEIIPEIPKHWSLVKLKRVLAEKLKYGATESGELDNLDDPRYIRITDFNDDGTLRDDTFKSLPYDIAEPFLLNEGDVLFARSGATVGKTFIFKNYEGIACFAGYLIKAVTLSHKMLPEFLFYYTKTKMYEDWKNMIFTQATIQNIGADKYQYLPITVPTLEEQKIIVRKIDLLIEKNREAQSKIEKQIEALSNYKKSLIHEVVTGKKQVYAKANEN